MKTIAVGPFEPEDTFGLTVAMPLLHRDIVGRSRFVAGVAEATCLVAHAQCVRRAIV